MGREKLLSPLTQSQLYSLSETDGDFYTAGLRIFTIGKSERGYEVVREGE